MQRLLITATLALATIGSTAVAQQAAQTAPAQQQGSGFGQRHRARDPHKIAMRMSQRLNLSADQTARLEPILVARQQKMNALRADQSLPPDARRAQFRAIHEETQQQLAGVLTPDQLAQVKSMRHEHGRHQSQPMQPATAPSA